MPGFQIRLMLLIVWCANVVDDWHERYWKLRRDQIALINSINESHYPKFLLSILWSTFIMGLIVWVLVDWTLGKLGCWAK